MNQIKHNSQPTVSELRRERERTAMAAKIMSAARKMFVSDGYEAVTLRKVATAIEYSPAAIYQYFKDKESLVRAIIKADSQDLREYVVNCLEVEDPIDRLDEMARRYVNWAIEHPNHYRLMLVPPPVWAKQQDLPEAERAPMEQEALFALNAIVKEAIDLGILKEKYTNSTLVAATLWAGIHGTLLLEITVSAKVRAQLGGKDISFETRFETILEMFRDALLKDSTERPLGAKPL